jgi:hypothetical protein
MTTDTSSGDDTSGERNASSVSEDEQGLRAAFVGLAEHMAADWASSNLAVVIHQAGDAGWAATAEKHRERATMMLAVRLFHAIRATMAVLGAGYEVEGRAMARLVLETRARLLEVTEDASQETGKRWLERKPQKNITEAIQASAPDIDPELPKHLYGGLSQDSHANVGGIMRSLTTVDEDLSAVIAWGPHRTDDTRRSLLLCAGFAAEAAATLAVEAGVDHPNSKALVRYLQALEARLGQ